MATKRCVAAGGNKSTIQVVEVDIIPISYVTNGATRVIVRVVGDLVDGYEEREPLTDEEDFQHFSKSPRLTKNPVTGIPPKGSSNEVTERIDSCRIGLALKAIFGIFRN